LNAKLVKGKTYQETMEIPSSQFWEIYQPCARQETQTLAVLLTCHAWAVEAVLLGTER
jgi:hypothetical protein